MNLKDQQKIRVGACAWSFDDWRGAFYPPDLPQSHWLEFYARYFPTVEVDSTFYGPPAEDVVRRWVETTPATFRFCCKLPREITHVCRLRDCTVELDGFLRAIEPLAQKLQVILIQLPPSFAPKDGKQPLRKFLTQLPRDFRFAIEFRHAGWHRPQIISLLEKCRVCWVWADVTPLNERNLAPFEFLPRTTDFVYLRLRRCAEDEPTGYPPAALDEWAAKAREWAAEGRDVFLYFINGAKVRAPAAAQALIQRL